MNILYILIRSSQQDADNGKSQRDLDRQIRDECIGLINASLDATAAGNELDVVLRCAAQQRAGLAT